MDKQCTSCGLHFESNKHDLFFICEDCFPESYLDLWPPEGEDLDCVDLFWANNPNKRGNCL